jgi:hypothetical protein
MGGRVFLSVHHTWMDVIAVSGKIAQNEGKQEEKARRNTLDKRERKCYNIPRNIYP